MVEFAIYKQAECGKAKDFQRLFEHQVFIYCFTKTIAELLLNLYPQLLRTYFTYRMMNQV